MTNRHGNRATQFDRRTTWAREQLAVSDEASPEEVRARFLNLLDEEQFVPDESVCQAFLMLRENADGISFLDAPPECVAMEMPSRTCKP